MGNGFADPRQIAGLGMHAIANDHSLAEGQPWIGAIPVHEFVARMAMARLGIRAGKTIENGVLRDFSIR